MPGNQSDGCHGFLTILDNVLTVSGSARVEGNELHQPQQGGLPEGAGGVMKNSDAPTEVRALQKIYQHRQVLS